MSKYYADTAIRIAKAEKGYIEKASNKNLNSKKANPGSNNYTKYGVITGTNGDYWCASYICWVMYKLCGSSKTTARKLLCGAFSAACETLRTAFVQKKRYYKKPAAGDLVFFSGTRHSGANHIGIVTKVSGSKIYTMEGNTSNGSSVVDNGGSVCEKSYSTSHSRILGYGRPLYDPKPDCKTSIKTKCRLYKSANTVKGYFGTLPAGKQIEFVKDQDSGWSQARAVVANVVRTGYVKNTCLKKSGLSKYRKGIVKAPTSDIHQKNKKSSKVQITVPKGSKVTVVSIGKQWSNIKYKRGSITYDGFVLNKELTVR